MSMTWCMDIGRLHSALEKSYYRFEFVNNNAQSGPHKNIGELSFQLEPIVTTPFTMVAKCQMVVFA